MNTFDIEIPDYVALTGRVRTFIENPEKGTFPASCTVYLYDNKLEEVLTFVSRALRGGAGVKVQLENFVPRKQVKTAWFFTINSEHPDYEKLSSLPGFIQQHFIDSSEVMKPPFRYIIVNDSMEESWRSDGAELGPSIEKSWALFIDAYLSGYVPVIDLSELRPAGTTNELGLVATGPLGNGDVTDFEAGSFVSIYARIAEHLSVGNIISFMQLLGQLNRTLRRGGRLKNGIVCTAINEDHPNVKQYLRFPLSKLVGSQKKGIRLSPKILANKELSDLVVDKVNEESLFLEKIDFDQPDLYANVCEEIWLKHRASCLLAHVNAGMLAAPAMIPMALAYTTEILAKLHTKWRKVVGSRSELYLPLEEDKQIGVGWIGWANFLAAQGVTYAEHTEALFCLLDFVQEFGEESIDLWESETKAEEIAFYLYKGYQLAATVAVSYGLERAFTMAPTQTVAYQHKDLAGHICSRAIDPPLNRRVRRDSDRLGAKWYYHGPVETCADVGSLVHELHWDQWQRLMDTTGLAHSMSYDHWSKITYEWLENFILRRNLKTTYYNFADQLDQVFLNKGIAPTAVDEKPVICELTKAGECSSCAE